MKLAVIAAAVVVSIPPLTFQDDNYVYNVYNEDPCVEVLKMAMARMEPFIPLHYHREGTVWTETSSLTRDDLDDLVAASQVWREAKMQCWRSS